jgi:hypothetical protein
MNTAAVALKGAVRELLDISRGVALSPEVGLLFALSWLAAGRTTAAGWTRNSQLQELANQEYWSSTLSKFLPPGSQEAAWSRGIGNAERLGAVAAVARLIDEAGVDYWQVRDFAWDFAGSTSLPALAPELCDLAFDILNPEEKSTVWLPFETTGQFVGRAMDRGLKAVCVGPSVGSNLLARLVVLIEAATLRDASKVSFEPPSEAIETGQFVFAADWLIAAPPMGARVPTQMGWRRWEAPAGDIRSSGLYRSVAGNAQLELERSDAWSVGALWPRVKRRAVFIVSPSVLFTRGQEQRLRETLLVAPSHVEAVIGLPARQTTVSALTPAAILLSRKAQISSLRLVDASHLTEDNKSSMRSTRRLLPDKVVAALKSGQPANVVIDLPLEEARAQESILTPSRYVGRPSSENQIWPRVPLGDLVTLVRPPATTKAGQGILVHEVGTTDLEEWSALSPPFGKRDEGQAKTAVVLAKRLPEFALAEGDLVVSTKGSVGRSGIIGLVAPADVACITAEVLLASTAPTAETPVVVSQSCVALRPKHGVSPEMLFLYLRSRQFRDQIERLKVGAAIAHVSPSSLLAEISVPVLDAGEQQRHLEQLRALRALENVIREASAQTRTIEERLYEESSTKNSNEE